MRAWSVRANVVMCVCACLHVHVCVCVRGVRMGVCLCVCVCARASVCARGTRVCAVCVGVRECCVHHGALLQFYVNCTHSTRSWR